MILVVQRYYSKTLFLLFSLDFCPKGILCGLRLKTCVREYVRRRRRRRTDFWEFCHRVEVPRTRFLGATVKASFDRWNLRIGQFCKNIPTICNTRPVKNTLFQSKSPRLVNGRSFENWWFLDPDCSRVFILLSTFLSVVHAKWPEGHPCPAGVI